MDVEKEVVEEDKQVQSEAKHVDMETERAEKETEPTEKEAEPTDKDMAVGTNVREEDSQRTNAGIEMNSSSGLQTP